MIPLPWAFLGACSYCLYNRRTLRHGCLPFPKRDPTDLRKPGSSCPHGTASSWTTSGQGREASHHYFPWCLLWRFLTLWTNNQEDNVPASLPSSRAITTWLLKVPLPYVVPTHHREHCPCLGSSGIPPQTNETPPMHRKEKWRWFLMLHSNLGHGPGLHALAQ